MSNLIKFILMALAWIVFFLATFYGCIKDEYCPAEEVVDTTTVVPPAVTDDYAIVSSYGSNDVLTGSQWAAERDALLAKYNADSTQALEITGHYYEGETAPAGFADMGLYRADKIKQMMVAAGIPADNIRTLSKMLPAPAPAAGELWDAANFAWASTDQSKPQVVEVADNEIKILFPFDKSTKDLGADVENYLKTLAERVAQTKETISIVGHTDNIDTDAYNMTLGQKRADFVKQRLMRYGVDAALISTSSKGESQPEASNATEDGRYRNRRAVVTLNRAQ